MSEDMSNTGASKASGVSGEAGIYEIALRQLDGAATTLGAFAGRVLLIVNVASECSLTPQYEGLEALYQRCRDRGLVIAGFPANDFAAQEPGSSDQIATFCKASYAVDFPLFEKVTVVGPNKHPLYQALIQARPTAQLPAAAETAGASFRQTLASYLAGYDGSVPNPEPEVLWNFEKFLVSRTGQVVGRFSPDMTPDDPALVAAIETELAREGKDSAG